jgi:hypothetical protein
MAFIADVQQIKQLSCSSTHPADMCAASIEVLRSVGRCAGQARFLLDVPLFQPLPQEHWWQQDRRGAASSVGTGHGLSAGSERHRQCLARVTAQ